MIIKKISSLLKGIKTPGQRFKDNGDGTATDTKTGLVWLKHANPCPEGTNWTDAMDYCGILASGTAGLTDWSSAGTWRLPTKDELAGLGTDPPAAWDSGYPSVAWTIPGEPFSDVQTDYYYWSSTTRDESPVSVWSVYMYDGLVSRVKKSYSNFYVWPVRKAGGQED